MTKKDIQNENENTEEILEEETVTVVEEPNQDKEIEELTIKLMRLQADFVNFRKRTEKEKENYISYGIESIVSDLLPILDNFQRAIDSEDDKESSFYKGVEMISDQMKNLLIKNGIEELDDLGNEFDPNMHHAVLAEENEEYEANKVIGVLQKGYKFKDKIIRPSMVIVSK